MMWRSVRIVAMATTVTAMVVAGTAIRTEATSAGAGPVQVNPPGQPVSEFTVTRDPLHPAHLFAGAILLGTAGAHCGVYRSFDNGRSWSPASSPFPAGDPAAAASADPWIGFDAHDRLQLTCLGAGGTGEHTEYFVSADSGTSWSAPVTIPTADPTASPDKPATLTLPDGTLVNCQLQGSGGPTSSTEGLGIATSADGQTWTASLPPALADQTCFDLANAGRKTVVIGMESLGGSTPLGTVSISTSSDDGHSWSAPRSAFTAVTPAPPPTFPQYYTQSSDISSYFPTMAIAGQTAYLGGSTTTDSQHWQLALAAVRLDLPSHPVASLAPPAPPSAMCRQNVLDPILTADAAGGLWLEMTCRTDPQDDRGQVEVWLLHRAGTGWTAVARLAASDSQSCPVPDSLPGSVTQASPCDRYIDGGDYWWSLASGSGIQAFWETFGPNGTAIVTRPLGSPRR